MKTIYLLILLAIPVQLLSQTTGYFKLFYKPKSQYNFNTEYYSVLKSSLEGDKNLVSGINTGLIFPLTVTGSSSAEFSMITGNAVFDNSLPVLLTFNKGLTKTIINETSRRQKSQLVGITVEGVIINNSKLILNPNNKKVLDDSKKQEILTTINTAEYRIQFPDRQLIIGDQFSQTDTMDIPINGLKTVHCIVNTTFILSDTLNNVAHFGLSQTIIQDKNKKIPDIDVNGIGNGDVEYDIQNNYLKRHVANSSITFTFKSENLSVRYELNSTVNRQIQLKY
jgi:hypothetical protein